MSLETETGGDSDNYDLIGGIAEVFIIPRVSLVGSYGENLM
jgi:hypothetical protein